MLAPLLGPPPFLFRAFTRPGTHVPLVSVVLPRLCVCVCVCGVSDGRAGGLTVCRLLLRAVRDPAAAPHMRAPRPARAAAVGRPAPVLAAAPHVRRQRAGLAQRQLPHVPLPAGQH